jgi:hypothetical protein
MSVSFPQQPQQGQNLNYPPQSPQPQQPGLDPSALGGGGAPGSPQDTYSPQAGGPGGQPQQQPGEAPAGPGGAPPQQPGAAPGAPGQGQLVQQPDGSVAETGNNFSGGGWKSMLNPKNLLTVNGALATLGTVAVLYPFASRAIAGRWFAPFTKAAEEKVGQTLAPLTNEGIEKAQQSFETVGKGVGTLRKDLAGIKDPEKLKALRDGTMEHVNTVSDLPVTEEAHKQALTTFKDAYTALFDKAEEAGTLAKDASKPFVTTIKQAAENVKDILKTVQPAEVEKAVSEAESKA